VVSQTTSTPKVNSKLKRTLQQIEEWDKQEEVWEKKPKTGGKAPAARQPHIRLRWELPASLFEIDHIISI
jgi:hypothetical protein